MATFVDIATEEAQLSELAVQLNKLQVSKDGGENESNAQSLKDLSELAKNSKVKEVLTNVIDRLDLVLADANEKGKIKDLATFKTCPLISLVSLAIYGTTLLKKWMFIMNYLFIDSFSE